MKKLLLIVITTIAMVSSAALAGLVQPARVSIDLDAKYAHGDMYTARTAMNEVEFIGCGTRHFDDGTGNEFLFGFCQAGDAADNQITCFTQDESLLETMRAATAYAYITFSWKDEGTFGTECTRVGFSTQSFYLPKK